MRLRLKMRRAANKAKSGDVIEIKLTSGELAYVQYLGHAQMRPFVRVLPGRYNTRPDIASLVLLAGGPDVYVLPSMLAGNVSAANGTVVANSPIPEPRLERPPLRKRSGTDDWKIIDSDGNTVKRHEFAQTHPEIDQSKLAWDEICSPALLWHMLDIGWHPRDAKDAAHSVPWPSARGE